MVRWTSVCCSPRFREKFTSAPIAKQLVHWFPGHMAKGLRLMQQHLRRCDAVIEVHDARIETSGRNDKFNLLAGKPRLLLLNKMDLAGIESGKRTDALAAKIGPNVLYGNCSLQSSREIYKIIPRILDMIDPQTLGRQVPYLRIMIVGIPNVGKSSLINALRRMHSGRGKVAATGNRPGVTRKVQTDIKIHESPPVYLVDTPGVMLPDVGTIDVGLKLAAVGTLRDDLVGEELIADYILFMLNKKSLFNYVERFKLDEPTDEISFLLPKIAKQIGALLPGGLPNIEAAAKHFINKYRDGSLGTFKLDISIG